MEVRSNLMASCLECNQEIRVQEDSIDGEIVTCGDCGTSFELEISDSGVLTLKAAESVGEDWGE
jgi:alpha-aminoadipate/glutamate carrier protein LysW